MQLGATGDELRPLPRWQLVHSNNGALFVVSLEHFQSFIYDLTAQSFLLLRSQVWITDRVRNSNTGEDSVDADHLSDVRNSSNLNSRNTNFFNLSRNR